MIDFPHAKWDINLVLFFNQFCGKSLTLDTISLIFLSVDALRTAILVAFVVGIWNYGKLKNDISSIKRVIYILISIIITLGVIEILNAIIQSPRPIVSFENLIQEPLTVTNTSELWKEGWARNSKHGSFPSDTIALLATMSIGLFLWNRTVGLLAIIFVIFAGILPRLYFGLHYASDMFIGLLIAILSTIAIEKIKIFNRLSDFILKIEEKFPYVFGVIGFYIAYIIADKFILLRKLPLWLKSILH